ncbi:RNA polymerase factor sigma-54 [Carnobacterium maltaromaticum]|uniref:RNA polymerase sigma-54 factor n=1 Tax=Carnobacterium maltaromaticum LMA28 TaxID=1234679 RepID=K8EJS7_CARML|nr:RNA polymerase factor sigma-54 [Carnobacterium maltaromaticum]KRN66341.1 RNA polymerase sigma-54 factor [Carnobacterium maltaromaticum DSM 20342]CCO12118.2 RNA polymerase sigma-54 factor [Carnobacterium maltaromaticum LMA28]
MNFEQKFSQQQKQVQKMAMTQQLQQSIQMLQYNADELISFLEQKALENPLIEVTVERDFAEEAALYPIQKTNYQNSSGQDEQNYLNQVPDTSTSLFEFLLEQIHLTMRDTYLRELVLLLTENIDDNGYLKIDLVEVAKSVGAEEIQMLDALTLLQQLDPPGVGARNLQECLMLQIERDDRAPNMAYVIMEEEFENFANRKWKEITKKFDVSLAEIQEISDYVQTLTPRPGAVYDGTREQYIRPDLVVRIENESIKVLSTKTGLPVVNFQKEYYQEMSQFKDKDVTHFMKEKYNEYEWIKRSIMQRGETIVKVGTAIVERQKEFFINPEHPIKSLTLKEISEKLGIHESTVSRSVNGKYLETSFGIFELKSFFTNSLGNQNDGTETEEDISGDSVRKKLLVIIEEEDKGKPLSDQKIVELMKADGIDVSRRTIAKYRDILAIPSSSKRKRFD